MASVKDTKYTTKRADDATIRKAFKAGKKQFMLNGIEMQVSKLTRVRQVTLGGLPGMKIPETTQTLTENWLVAKPVDGMLPVLCIEEIPMKNGIARSK